MFSTLCEKSKRMILRKQYKFAPVKEFSDEKSSAFNLGIYRVEKAYIFSFDDYSLIGKSIDRKMVYFSESFNYSEHAQTFLCRKPLNLSTSIKLDKCVDLTQVWTNNYWHFTFEALTKLVALEKMGYDGSYLVPDLGFVHQLLAIIKIAPERIIKFCANTCYFVKELYVADLLTGQMLHENDALLQEARKAVLDGVAKSEGVPKNIYVKRVGRRTPINQDEIIALMEKYGFDIISPENLSVAEQINYFSNAKICITPHGGNSTNVVYMNKNTQFMELFGRAYINPCMTPVVKLLNLDYKMLVEKGEGKISQKGFQVGYRVDCDLLELAILKMLEGQ